jgi:hypothetical protein
MSPGRPPACSAGRTPLTPNTSPTQLHADALITLDRQLAHGVKDLVTVEPIEALY